MANFNKVMLMGNLTRDPELGYTQTQTAYAMTWTSAWATMPLEIPTAMGSAMTLINV